LSFLIPALLIAFGAFTLAAQTVLFREYLVACNGTEIGIGLFYATWFAWIAVGALLHRRWPPREGGAVRRLLWLLALYLPAAALQGVALRSLRGMAGVPAADLFPLGSLLWTTALANAPVGLITGIAFPTACAVVAQRLRSAERAATRTYVLESLGSFAGGIGATLLIVAGRSPLVILAAVALLLAVTGAAVAWRERAQAPAGVLAGLALLSLALAATPLGHVVEEAAEDVRIQRALPGYERLESRDTPYRHLILGKRDHQLIALSDGTILGSYPDAEADLLTSALTYAQRPQATRILLVGQGTESVASWLLRGELEQLVMIQPDEAAAAAVAPHLERTVGARLGYPAVERLYGDPRQRLANLAHREQRFDVIVLDLPDPASASANRTATAQFYEQCRAVLADDGVLMRRISTTINYLGSENVSYGASTLATLREVFDDVRLIPGETTWFVAGAPGAPSADPEELIRRYGSRPAELQHARIELFHSTVEPRRVQAVTAIYEAAIAQRGDELVNTDAAPIAYFLQLRVLARTVGSGVVQALDAARAAGVWLYLIPVLLGALAWLRGTMLFPARGGEGRAGGALLLGVAGAAAMATQVGLILAFQTRFGDLFLRVGVLNALFMAGLAAGGLAGARLLRGAGGWRVSAACGAAALLVATVAAGLPWLAGASHGVAQAAFYGLVLGAGVVFGAIFPVAGAWIASTGEDAGGVGALLESADHWGAALGAAVVGVAMIPLLGPSTTAAVLAATMAVVAVALPLPEWLRGAAEGSLAARVAEALARTGRHRIGVGGRTSGALLAAGLAVVIVAAIVRAGAPGPRIRFDPQALAPLAGEASVVEREHPFLHYRGIAPDGREGAVICASRAITDEIEGYGGPLNLLVAMGADGAVRDVQLLQSDETPAYLVGVDEWLGGLRELPLSAPIDPDAAEPIEVLTGATVTSIAALRTVDAVRRQVATRVLHLQAPPEQQSPSPWTRLSVLALVGLLIVAVPVLISGDRRARFALQLLSVAVAGVWFNQQLSAEHLRFLAQLRWPGGGNAESWVLLGGVLALGIAFGPAYCGVLCPLGVLQEWLGRLGLTRRPGERADRAGRALKYGLLLAITVAFLVTGSHAFLAFDPLQTHLGWRAGGALLALVLLVAGGAALFPRFWCRYLCVVGAALALLNRVAAARRLLPRRRHDRCDLGVTSAGDWDCIQCNRCGWLPGPRPRGDYRLLLSLLAAALVLIAVVIGGALQQQPLEGLGQTRPVDVDHIRQLIEQRELSDHPAEYWEPVD